MVYMYTVTPLLRTHSYTYNELLILFYLSKVIR